MLLCGCLQERFWDRGARTAETSPLVPDAGSKLLEERCKTLKAEMETALAATLQLIVSQVSGLAGALENTTRVFQDQTQGIHIEADQTAMAMTRSQEMFEAAMARVPSAPASS